MSHAGEARDVASRDSIATAMRRARRTAGLDQTAFARRLGELRGEKPHQHQTIGKWERGDSIPDALDLVNAARIADVPVSWLLGPEEFQTQLLSLSQRVEHLERLHPGLREPH